jgi:hypothetical protein
VFNFLHALSSSSGSCLPCLFFGFIAIIAIASEAFLWRCRCHCHPFLRVVSTAGSSAVSYLPLNAFAVLQIYRREEKQRAIFRTSLCCWFHEFSSASRFAQLNIASDQGTKRILLFMKRVSQRHQKNYLDMYIFIIWVHSFKIILVLDERRDLRCNHLVSLLFLNQCSIFRYVTSFDWLNLLRKTEFSAWIFRAQNARVRTIGFARASSAAFVHRRDFHSQNKRTAASFHKRDIMINSCCIRSRRWEIFI